MFNKNHMDFEGQLARCYYMESSKKFRNIFKSRIIRNFPFFRKFSILQEIFHSSGSYESTRSKIFKIFEQKIHGKGSSQYEEGAEMSTIFECTVVINKTESNSYLDIDWLELMIFYNHSTIE